MDIDAVKTIVDKIAQVKSFIYTAQTQTTQAKSLQIDVLGSHSTIQFGSCVGCDDPILKSLISILHKWVTEQEHFLKCMFANELQNDFEATQKKTKKKTNKNPNLEKK